MYAVPLLKAKMSHKDTVLDPNYKSIPFSGYLLTSLIIKGMGVGVRHESPP